MAHTCHSINQAAEAEWVCVWGQPVLHKKLRQALDLYKKTLSKHMTEHLTIPQ